MINDPIQDKDTLEIEALKAADDFTALGKKIQELFRMPQSLCKQRGDCCRIATFKGTLSHDEIIRLANSDEEDAPNAKDFLSLFYPYECQEDVQTIAPVFYQKVREAEPGATFFKCRYLSDDGRCQVHEDRPTGCRVYPFPHKNTIYHPGCGFEKRGQENWKKIQDISQFFEQRLDELTRIVDGTEMLLDQTEPTP